MADVHLPATLPPLFRDLPRHVEVEASTVDGAIAELDARWPGVDDLALVQDEMELVLQINGKHRGSVRVPATASRHEIEHLTLASEDYVKFTGGTVPKKVIVVPGRLVNVVI